MPKPFDTTKFRSAINQLGRMGLKVERISAIPETIAAIESQGLEVNEDLFTGETLVRGVGRGPSPVIGPMTFYTPHTIWGIPLEIRTSED